MAVSVNESRVGGDGGPLVERPTRLTVTIELGLYGILALIALTVRLVALGSWPLLDAELHSALAALRTLEGSPWRPGLYSPLLYDVNLALFALTQATDAAVRLVPALAGAGLVLLPYMVRDILGRQGALVVAGLAALAPTWVLASRTGDGALLGTACGAALIVFGYRYLRDGRTFFARAALIALALGLSTSASFFTALLAALGLLTYLWVRQGQLALGPILATRIRAALTWRNLGLLAGVFVLVASAFLVNPGGVGVSVALAGHWVRRLLPKAALVPWWTLPHNLLLYEALTVALALVGLVVGFLYEQRLTVWLGLWAGGAIFLGTVLGHREALWLLDPLLPLVVLAGLGAQRLWDYLAPEACLLDLAIASLLLVPVVFVYLELAGYLHSAIEAYLNRMVLGVVAALAAWVGYAFWNGRRSALRVATALSSAILMVVMLRSTTALAYQTARDPYEGLLYRPTSIQLYALEETMRDLSYRHTGDAHALRVGYEESLDLWMGWYLRSVQAVPGVVSVEGAPVLVTWMRSADDRPEGYVAERFRLLEVCEGPVSWREMLRWLLYRYPPRETQPVEIQVWTTLPRDVISIAGGSTEGTSS